ILAKVRMIPNAGQCQRVQHLQHQRTDAATDHGGEISMHPPADAVRAKQAGGACWLFVVDTADRQSGEVDDLAFYVALYEFHGFFTDLAIPVGSVSRWPRYA